ncbi:MULTISPECIES: nitrogenase component 1 [Clostridium]|uniref:nitrogenase component 1 n=1 Tax=Clostridium TaxID=1485 RepID=UPI000826E2F1|nr:MULTISPECIES: nitrogenase component 1 [Clostridium]PJI10438.1 oxidoreductase [Clostridium sp. CT7]
MRQTASFISTYSADEAGICSALYELGGMTVIHDPSGCNSTYTTHDEPRWYDMDSMIYISGLSEIEAIMGDDDKLINDILEAAKQLSPRFIAIAGSPIPMMVGTDIEAIAKVVEHRAGIPTFGFLTNGMNSYLSGASMAFKAVAERMVDRNISKDSKLSLNIIGATPLDFSVNGSVDSIKKLLIDNGLNIVSTWAMGSTLDEIKKSGQASVNLVISYSGLAAAEELKKMFGTPYVVGVPYGKTFSKQIIQDLKAAVDTGENKVCYTKRLVKDMSDITIIGESVMSGSIAAAINAESGRTVQVLCPLETEQKLMADGDFSARDEDDLAPYLKKSKILIADPMYRPICPKNCEFIALPHEAFSGRIYSKDIPNLVEDFKLKRN